MTALAHIFQVSPSTLQVEGSCEVDFDLVAPTCPLFAEIPYIPKGTFQLSISLITPVWTREVEIIRRDHYFIVCLKIYHDWEIENVPTAWKPSDK